MLADQPLNKQTDNSIGKDKQRGTPELALFCCISPSSRCLSPVEMYRDLRALNFADSGEQEKTKRLTSNCHVHCRCSVPCCCPASSVLMCLVCSSPASRLFSNSWSDVSSRSKKKLVVIDSALITFCFFSFLTSRADSMHQGCCRNLKQGRSCWNELDNRTRTNGSRNGQLSACRVTSLPKRSAQNFLFSFQSCHKTK